VAVSEGISDITGTAIAAAFSKEVDSHGNVQLSGSGALGDALSNLIKSKTDITRVRADTFGYLQRSFRAWFRPTTRRKPSRSAARRSSWPPAATSTAAWPSAARRQEVPGLLRARRIAQRGEGNRHMPDEFIAANGCDVTPAFLDYPPDRRRPAPIGPSSGFRSRSRNSERRVRSAGFGNEELGFSLNSDL
jgi:6-phosphofructokinase 1